MGLYVDSGADRFRDGPVRPCRPGTRRAETNPASQRPPIAATQTLQWLFFFGVVALSVGTAIHALLFKREPRAALGWVAFCLMFPPAGPLIYLIFGVNRIRQRARKLESESPFRIDRSHPAKAAIDPNKIPAPLDEIARMSNALARRPLVRGNAVHPLHNGEAAYPEMLAAIEAAERTVYLTSYIFETNAIGIKFIQALARARKRGVDARVILDGCGEFYSLPRAGNLLIEKGVRLARFLPPRLFPPTLRINLRNHRKLMVTDTRTAFVGGMNIGDRHLANRVDNPDRVVDLHFRLEGPVVGQIEEIFLEDWRFSTGEALKPGEPPAPGEGETICRAIVNGPNERIDRLAILLVCAISSARKEVCVMTPYFIPPAEMSAALQAAALRGVAVHVVLPAQNNLPPVAWAMMNGLEELLQHGVNVYFQPPPFVHTKLFVVDGHYAQIGSANIDPRSLRLNFELTVELYGSEAAQSLLDHFHRQRERSEPYTLEKLEARSLPTRIRDAAFWLFSPYF
ncbi:MAG: phospholipase D-like domain-containing protein [Thermodesulfobacteriota bacterium]